MHVYICLLTSKLYLYVCPSRSGLFHALYPLWASSCRSLGPLTCVVAFVPFVAYMGVTTCEIHLYDASFFDAYPFFALCDVLMLAFLAFCHSFGFFASLHLCTLAYMFMHKSVCHPYSNPMELWTLNPNLHLSSQDTFFCLITCCLPLFNSLSLLDILSFSMLSFYLFLCLSAGLFLLSLHVHAWSEDAWSQGMTSQTQTKRARIQARRCKPTKSNVQQITRPSPSKVVFSFPLFKPLLQSMYQGPPPCTPFYFPAPFLGHILQVWQCLFVGKTGFASHTKPTAEAT